MEKKGHVNTPIFVNEKQKQTNETKQKQTKQTNKQKTQKQTSKHSTFFYDRATTLGFPHYLPLIITYYNNEQKMTVICKHDETKTKQK